MELEYQHVYIVSPGVAPQSLLGVQLFDTGFGHLLGGLRFAGVTTGQQASPETQVFRTAGETKRDSSKMFQVALGMSVSFSLISSNQSKLPRKKNINFCGACFNSCRCPGQAQLLAAVWIRDSGGESLETPVPRIS